MSRVPYFKPLLLYWVQHFNITKLPITISCKGIVKSTLIPISTIIVLGKVPDFVLSFFTDMVGPGSSPVLLSHPY